MGQRSKSGMHRDVRSGTACLVTPPLVAGGMAIQTAREGAPLLLSREVKDAAKGAAELSHHAAESMMPQACRGVNQPAGVAPHVLSPKPPGSAPASNVQQMQEQVTEPEDSSADREPDLTGISSYATILLGTVIDAKPTTRSSRLR